MKRTRVGRGQAEAHHLATEPVVADIDGIRLRLHARRLRGQMTLVEAARRADLNRDELSRLERGETMQVRFTTLAKLIAAYDCTLDELVEVERTTPATALYLGTIAAFTDGTVPVTTPQRRAVRRPAADDLITPDEAATWGPDPGPAQSPQRRRSPIGTVHR